MAIITRPRPLSTSRKILVMLISLTPALAFLATNFSDKFEPSQLKADTLWFWYHMRVDRDWDGMPDEWEENYFGNTEQVPHTDYDADGLSNGNECNPEFVFDDPNTINDCLTKGIPGWTNPLNPDTDNDGILDGDEFWGRVGGAGTGGSTIGVGTYFADVPANHRFAAEITAAQELGLIPEEGIFQNKFRPDKAMTRSEAIASMVEVSNTPIINADKIEEKPFVDVGLGYWDGPYIATAKLYGLISYIPEDNTFRPTEPVTRSELLEFVFRGVGVRKADMDEITDSPYSDVELTSWDAPYIIKAGELGIMEGYQDGTFRPENPVTRGEAMGVILRATEVAGE